MNIRHLFAAALTVCAATAVQATDIDQLRIYINPGHGSWTSGDRAMATIKHGPYNGTNYPDTTGFFESNTNMWKGLELMQRLVNYGLKFDPTLNQGNENEARRGAALDMNNNVVMSHVKLGPYPLDNGDDEAYNRNLYEIASEVERNNFDFFISIHSNAHVDGNNTNYPAFFVRGENSTASVEGSDDACRTVWPYAYSDEHQSWSNYSMTSMGIYYDIDFWSGDYLISTIDGKSYKGYYGVLRHGVKGFLVEGYFHTYQPSRHRAMNPDVCRHEGLGYAHGLAELFDIPTETTGELYGIVRDRYERFTHTYYNCKASSYDAYKPINNAEVILYRDGVEVSRYTTDDEYNGAFLFRDIEPGTYTISVTAPGYLPAEEDFCGPFTVEAAKCTYPRVYLTSEDYVPPEVVYYDYPDPAEGSNLLVGSTYEFTRTFTDKVSAAVKDKTVKRMIERNGYLYVLAYDADSVPSITVLNEGNFSTLAKVSVEGCEGTDRALADIQVTADGVLIGCSMELCQLTDDYVEDGETRGECNIYRWTTNAETGLPEGDPRIWFTTKMTGNLYRAWTGRTMSYSGTFDEGRMVLSSASWYYNKKIFFTIIDILDGTKSSESFSNKSEVCDYFNADDLGEFTFTTSPLNSGSFITESGDKEARQYTIDNMTLEGTLSTDLVDARSQQAGYFRMAGHAMMVAPAVDADGNNIGVNLLDITDGLDNAKLLTTINTEIDAKEGVAAATGRAEVETDDDGNITDMWIDLYLVRNGRFTRFTTKGVEQPVAIPAYAYDLEASEASGEADLNFNLSDDATAHIRIHNNATGNIVDLPEIAGVKGFNTYHINYDDYEAGESVWSVVVSNETVTTAKALWTDTIAGNGVSIDNNDASPYFGQAYFTLKEGDRGIKVLTPMLEAVNDSPYQSGLWDLTVGASCWRSCVLDDGTVLVSDWGDNAGGIYIFDPSDPTANRKELFVGTRNSSTGEITNDAGKVIGGSTSGMCPLGMGSDMVLYSFQEDYPSSSSKSMVGYELGTSRQISSEPELNFPTLAQYLINGNVNVVATDKALFLSQTRSSGNNARGVPVFIVADYDQNILYNSGADWESLNGGDGALAVSSDLTTMAVSDASETVHIMSITWEPTFTLTETASIDLNSGACYQMAFDRAGRLYVATRTYNAVFTVPQEAKDVVTDCATPFNATGGISAVSVDDGNAPAEWYNMQGMRVDEGNLSPGIYIRRQGNMVSKILVK